MEAFEQRFQHFPEYQVVVCKKCQSAVIPAHIQGHLQSQHIGISPKEWKESARIAAELPNVAHSAEKVQYPSAEEPPIGGLPIFVDGLRCTATQSGQQCRYICRERTGIQRHCREVHQWQNPRKRGRPSNHTSNASTVQAWSNNQACQRFFKTGQWQQYFPVRVQTEDADDENRGGHPSNIQQGQAFLTQLFHQFDEAKRQDREQGGRHRYEANPWLEHTGWEGHIGGHKQSVIQMIRPVVDAKNGEDGPPHPNDGIVSGEDNNNIEAEDSNADSEQALGEACKATIVLIRRSFDVCRPEIVGRSALEYVNRREAGAVNNDKPFYGKQKVKTLQKYADRWTKILRYLWRSAEKEKGERPDYRMTQKQKDAMAHLKEVSSSVANVEEDIGSNPPTSRQRTQKQRQQLVEVSMSFWIAMFDHELKDQDYESGILSGLAVLGLDTEHGGWMPAINYTPILAAIITTLRAIVVRRAWRTRIEAIQANIRSGMPDEAARDRAPSVLEGVQELVHQFMTLTTFEGKPSPLNRIFQQKTYGMKIRYTTKGEGQIGWEGDDTIVVRKIKFKMDDVRTLVHALVSEVRQRLVRELLGYTDVQPATSSEWRPPPMPRFDLSTLSDDHAALEEGWSFIRHVQNQWEVDGKQWMGLRVFDDPVIRRRFIVNGGEQQADGNVMWNEKAVRDYFRQVRRFKEELIVLVHMSAGAPARATELISIQHENGPHARSQRGVFIDNGMVVIVTDYHKGFSASQHFKIIHRYVPREVGELVVYHLWLIEPFVRILQGATQEQDLFGSWLWEPTPEDEWPEEEEEEGEEGEEGGEEDDEPGHDSRNNSRIETPTDPPTSHIDGGWEDFNDVEGNMIRQQHRAQPEPRNSDGFWDTDRVRRVMRRETAKRIGVPIGTSDWRQAYPAIHREFAINDDVRATLKQIYEQQSASQNDPAVPVPSMAAFRAKQSGHSQQMEENIYGLCLRDSPFTTMAERDAFRRVSVDWHRFLGFPSAWKVEGIDPDVRRRVKAEQDAGQMHRWQQMRQIDIHAQLKQLYRDPDARLRGLQQTALETIVGGHPRVVIVMRTGGGKSLLFMLPAMASASGVSIVVIPKKALQSDLQQRCQAAGIRTAIWSGGKKAPPYDSQIVFVIAESAITATFTDFINSKKVLNQLERIVIDECHSILQATDEYRSDMRELCELASKGVQVVCMTATLPPKKQAQMLAAVDFAPHETCVLRDSTTRPNIAYSVVEYNREEEVAVVQEMVERKKAQYPDGQIIVYCRSIVETKEFAVHLGGQAFYSGIGTDAEKDAILEKLRRREERVFTSTNALGEGIDAPGVRVIIHIGMIDSLDDYGQQSGRAGRDGHSASEAIMLHKTWVGRDGQIKREQRWRAEAEMKAFVQGDGCRRVVLDRYMDGRGDAECDERAERKTCEPGEQRCDVCQGRGTKRVRVVFPDDSDDMFDMETAEEERLMEARVRRFEEERTEMEEQQQQRQRKAKEEEQARQAQRRREREMYEGEKRQFAAIAQRQRSERIEQGGELDVLMSCFEEWKTGCSTCRVLGRPGCEGHGWRQCRVAEGEREVIEGIWERLKSVKWAGIGGCCGSCWAPQAICHSYQSIDSGGRARFRKGGGRCQFKGVLREAVAAMLAAQGEEVAEWIIGEAERSGMGVQEGETAWEEIIRPWMASKVVYSGIEMTGMCRMFGHFAVQAR